MRSAVAIRRSLRTRQTETALIGVRFYLHALRVGPGILSRPTTCVCGLCFLRIGGERRFSSYRTHTRRTCGGMGGRLSIVCMMSRMYTGEDERQ